MKVIRIIDTPQTPSLKDYKPFEIDGVTTNRVDIIDQGSVVASLLVDAQGRMEIRTTKELSVNSNVRVEKPAAPTRKKKGCCF